MDQDIQAQLDRANELMKELERECNTDLHAKNVSGKTKNLSQEVLLKVRHLLDQSFYKYFEKHYLPNLSNADEKHARVYFPIVSEKDKLKSVLGMAKMGDLEKNNQNFYKFLESIQPYNQDYLWLMHLKNYSNEKHTRLTPQKKIEIEMMSVNREGSLVTWPQQGVIFGGGVEVLGVPIDPKTQMPVPNDVVQTKIETWVSFLYENSDVNVLYLCKKSVEDGEKIIRKILEFV